MLVLNIYISLMRIAILTIVFQSVLLFLSASLFYNFQCASLIGFLEFTFMCFIYFNAVMNEMFSYFHFSIIIVRIQKYS